MGALAALATRSMRDCFARLVCLAPADLDALRLAAVFLAAERPAPERFEAPVFAPPRREADLVERADADRLELPRCDPPRFLDFAAPAFLRDFFARVAMSPSRR